MPTILRPRLLAPTATLAATLAAALASTLALLTFGYASEVAAQCPIGGQVVSVEMAGTTAIYVTHRSSADSEQVALFRVNHPGTPAQTCTRVIPERTDTVTMYSIGHHRGDFAAAADNADTLCRDRRPDWCTQAVAFVATPMRSFGKVLEPDDPPRYPAFGDGNVVTVDGVVVAASLKALIDGRLEQPLETVYRRHSSYGNATSDVPNGEDVDRWHWTGMAAGGARAEHDCGGWTDADDSTGAVGSGTSSDGTEHVAGGEIACGRYAHLLCVCS